MAEELWALGADLRVGDLAFGLGIPVLLKSQRVYETLGTLLLPLLTQLPIPSPRRMMTGNGCP
jgi:hypothetical protein